MLNVMRNARVTNMDRNLGKTDQMSNVMKEDKRKTNYTYLQPREACLCILNRLRDGEDIGRSLEFSKEVL